MSFKRVNFKIRRELQNAIACNLLHETIVLNKFHILVDLDEEMAVKH